MGFRVPSGGGKSGGKGGFRIPTTRPDAPSSKFKPFKNVNVPKVSPVRSFSTLKKPVDIIVPAGEPPLIPDFIATLLSITTDQNSVSVDFNVSETADIYAVLLLTGAGVPSKAQIIAGTDSLNNPAPFDFSLNVSLGTFEFTGLLPETDYTVYIVGSNGVTTTPIDQINDLTTAAAALTYLTANARAGWEFVGISGEEDDVIAARTDLTGNGFDLNDEGGTLTAKIGFIQKSIGNLVSALKSNTASTIKQALVTNSAAEGFLKNSFEIFYSGLLNDGQSAASYYLFGTSDGGTRYFDVKVNATGFIEIRYSANAAGLSTWRTTDNPLPDGATGIFGLHIIMDFANPLPRVIINGVECTVSLISGNTMATWVPANFRSTRDFAIGGTWSGSFAADTALFFKYCLKLWVTDIETDLNRAIINEHIISI